MNTALLGVAAALSTMAAPTVGKSGPPFPFGQPGHQAFAKGGVIRTKLAAGDYKIGGSTDDKIRVEWRADRAEQAANLKAEAEIRGTTAVISTGGFKNGIH